MRKTYNIYYFNEKNSVFIMQSKIYITFQYFFIYLFSCYFSNLCKFENVFLIQILSYHMVSIELYIQTAEKYLENKINFGKFSIIFFVVDYLPS